MSSEDIFEEELNQTEWNTIDTYPVFENCSENLETNQLKLCFEETLNSHINTYLLDHQQGFQLTEIDTMISVSISSRGIIGLDYDPSKSKSELESLLEEAFINLPKIYPAQKRGIPVATKFKLPITLN